MTASGKATVAEIDVVRSNLLFLINGTKIGKAVISKCKAKEPYCNRQSVWNPEIVFSAVVFPNSTNLAVVIPNSSVFATLYAI